MLLRGKGELSSLTGLEQLTSVDQLWIDSNGALASLLGLSGRTVVQREFAIHSNAALPPCWVSWLEQGLVTLGSQGDTSGNDGEGSCPGR